MADNEPEYLKRLKGDAAQSPPDNFDHTDIYWGWDDESFDPREFLDQHGFEPEGRLELLLKALIVGHTPDILDDDLRKRYKKAFTAITGRPVEGPNKKDRVVLAKKVALEFHRQYYEQKMAGNTFPQIELKPIARSVAGEYFASAFFDAKQTGSGDANSLTSMLERDFNANRELWLTQASAELDFDRMDVPAWLIRILNDLDLPVDDKAMKRRAIW